MRSRSLVPTLVVGVCLLLVAVAPAAVADDTLSRLSEFIRVTKKPGVGDTVEISIRTYKAPAPQAGGNPLMGLLGGGGKPPPRPDIVLISMVHLGEKSYFARINDELEKCDLVLYEEMGDEAMRTMSGGLVAKMTGLAFQGTEVKVTKTWRSADLSQEALFQAMGISPEALKRMSGMMERLGDIDPSNLPRNPMMEQMLPTREKIIEQLRESGGAGEMIPGQMANFILYQRNAIIKSEMTKASYENGRKRVAVIYGAAHMPDVEKFLLEKLDYTYESGKTIWIDAVYEKPEGLTEKPTEPARPARPSAKPGKRVIY